MEKVFMKYATTEPPAYTMLEHLLKEESIDPNELNKQTNVLFNTYSADIHNDLAYWLVKHHVQDPYTFQLAVQLEDERFIVYYLSIHTPLPPSHLPISTKNPKLQKLFLHHSLITIPNRDMYEDIPLLTTDLFEYPDFSMTQCYYLYFPCILYPEKEYLCTRYWNPNLFILDNYTWNSVEQYTYYKMYESTPKAKYIRNIQTEDDMRQFVLLNKVKDTSPCMDILSMDEQVFNLIKQTKPVISMKKCMKHMEMATREKIKQNPQLHKLLESIDKPIVNKDFHDIFGYTGNLLGKLLMSIKHDNRVMPTTDNIRVSIYKPNPSYYVVRGNITNDTLQQLKKIGTYRNKNGKIIRLRYNPKLIEGGGWLIPKEHETELMNIVSKTYPENVRVHNYGKQWIHDKLVKLLSLSSKLQHMEGKNEISQRVLFCIIKEFYKSDELITGKKIHIPLSFKLEVCEILKKHNWKLSNASLEMLWEYINNLTREIFSGAFTLQDMKERIQDIDAIFIDSVSKQIPDSTIEPIIHYFILAFRRIFSLLASFDVSERVACFTALDMILGTDVYSKVRTLYKTKIKHDKRGKYKTDIAMFQERFDVHVHFLSTVIDLLPNVEKKCKLLLLTTIEFLESMPESTMKSKLKKEFFILQ